MAQRGEREGVFAFPASCLSPWQRERALRNNRICRAIHKARKRGKTFKRALRWPVWAWKKKPVFRCDRSRRVRLARSTILRLYYSWLAGGQSPQVFALHYRTPRKLTLSAEHLALFIRLASAPGVASLVPILEGLSRSLKVSARTVARAIPAHVITAARKLHRARRSAAVAEKHFHRAVTT